MTEKIGVSSWELLSQATTKNDLDHQIKARKINLDIKKLNDHKQCMTT